MITISLHILYAMNLSATNIHNPLNFIRAILNTMIKMVEHPNKVKLNDKIQRDSM